MTVAIPAVTFPGARTGRDMTGHRPASGLLVIMAGPVAPASGRIAPRRRLAEALRRDSRVVSMERTNARNLTAASLPERISLASVDVSFISLRLVLAPIASKYARHGKPGASAASASTVIEL